MDPGRGAVAAGLDLTEDEWTQGPGRLELAEDERSQAVRRDWWQDWRTSGPRQCSGTDGRTRGPVEMAQWSGDGGAGAGGGWETHHTRRSV